MVTFRTFITVKASLVVDPAGGLPSQTQTPWTIAATDCDSHWTLIKPTTKQRFFLFRQILGRMWWEDYVFCAHAPKNIAKTLKSLQKIAGKFPCYWKPMLINNYDDYVRLHGIDKWTDEISKNVENTLILLVLDVLTGGSIFRVSWQTPAALHAKGAPCPYLVTVLIANWYVAVITTDRWPASAWDRKPVFH